MLPFYVRVQRRLFVGLEYAFVARVHVAYLHDFMLAFVRVQRALLRTLEVAEIALFLDTLLSLFLGRASRDRRFAFTFELGRCARTIFIHLLRTGLPRLLLNRSLFVVVALDLAPLPRAAFFGIQLLVILRYVRYHGAAPFARETATVAREVTRLPVPMPLHVFVQDRSTVAFPITNNAQDFARIFLRRTFQPPVLLSHVNSQRTPLATTEVAGRAIVSSFPRRSFARTCRLQPMTVARTSLSTKPPGEARVVGDLVSVQHALHGKLDTALVAGVKLDGYLAQVDATVVHVTSIRVVALLALRFHERGRNVFLGSSLGLVQRRHQRIVQFTIGIDVLPKLHGRRVLANDESTGGIRGEDPLAADTSPKTRSKGNDYFRNTTSLPVFVTQALLTAVI